jgi:hypothetical protein
MCTCTTLKYHGSFILRKIAGASLRIPARPTCIVERSMISISAEVLGSTNTDKVGDFSVEISAAPVETVLDVKSTSCSHHSIFCQSAFVRYVTNSP